MPPLLANFIHARGCKPKCKKSLTLPKPQPEAMVVQIIVKSRVPVGSLLCVFVIPEPLMPRRRWR